MLCLNETIPVQEGQITDSEKLKKHAFKSHI